MDTMSVKLLNALPIFPFADEFPYISDEEMLELAQDIEENGLHHPIVLFTQTDAETGEMDDFVLDGRNRLKALAKTKLTEAPVEYYEGDDPIGYVYALNIARRHLTAGQRAMLALKYKEYLAAEGKRRMALAGKSRSDEAALVELQELGSGFLSSKIAGQKFGVSQASVDRANSVNLNAPDLAAQVKAGTLALDAAYNALKARQAAAPGSYDGSKAHESEPEKLAAGFEKRFEMAMGNALDAIKDYRATGYWSEDDTRYVESWLKKVSAA